MSGAIAVAAVGAIASGVMANQASKKAGKASDQQGALQAEDLAFRREQYQRYLGLMGPIEERLAAEAKSTQPLDYEPLAAKTKENYAAAQRGITTAMGLRGMAGSGLDEAAIRGAAFGQASDLSKDWAQGLVNRRNLGLTLTGRGQIGQAAQGVSGGLQNLSNFYGQQAGLNNQAAQQGWANFGQGLSNIAYGLGQKFGNKADQTSNASNTPDIEPINPQQPVMGSWITTPSSLIQNPNQPVMAPWVTNPSSLVWG